MARTKLITRTIESTKVTAMCVIVAEAKVENRDFTVAGTFANTEKLMKALKKQVENDELKVVSIVSQEVQQKMYGMTETFFLENAKELDENRKFLDVEIEEAGTEETGTEQE